MTTLAALLGSLPIALGTGAGSELRQPLGVAIVGGLCVSQLLTLYITPVVYIYLDKMDSLLAGRRKTKPKATADARARDVARAGRVRARTPGPLRRRSVVRPRVASHAMTLGQRPIANARVLSYLDPEISSRAEIHRHVRTQSLLFSAPRVSIRFVYSEWPGPPGARTLVCVHGLTRNGRDFEVIAEALSAHYRVICPDMPGRGRSDYLTKSAEYGYPLYVADAAALIARLDVESIDWLGTSMGGLIGMMLAAQPGNPICRLVLNDHLAVHRQGGARADRRLCRSRSVLLVPGGHERTNATIFRDFRPDDGCAIAADDRNQRQALPRRQLRARRRPWHW